MKVLVGSTNPVKLNSVRRVFERVWGEVEVVGVSVSSGVDEQPRSEEETVRGAINRAREAIKHGGDYGVGLEGGVYEQDGKLFECAWCAVVSNDDREGLGGGLRFELPPKVAKKIKEGGELGPVMNEFLDREDVKKQEGAVGVLTKKHVTRTSGYMQIVYLALMKFLSPEWYE